VPYIVPRENDNKTEEVRYSVRLRPFSAKTDLPMASIRQAIADEYIRADEYI